MLENPLFIGFLIFIGLIVVVYMFKHLKDDVKILLTKTPQIKWVKKPVKIKEVKERTYPLWLQLLLFFIAVAVFSSLLGVAFLVGKTLAFAD